MTAKTNSLENAWLLHYFNNSAIANVGDAGGLLASAAAGSLHVSLHTAYQGEAGAQNTSECAYGGYARQAVARSGAGWTVTNNQVINAAIIQFPQSSSAETAMFWGIGRSSGTGAGTLDYKGHIGTQPVAFTSKTTDTLTAPGHNLAVDNRCVLYATGGAQLPAGATEGTVYWVKTVSGDDITISTTQAGATLDLTTVGAGLIGKVTPLAIADLISPKFAAGALVLTED